MDNNFEYFSAKIYCKSPDKKMESYGTGTIVSDGNKYWVITALHCFKMEAADTESKLAEVSWIKISLYIGNNTEIPITIISSNVIFEEESDSAYVEIKKPDVDFDYTKIKLFNNFNYTFEDERYNSFMYPHILNNKGIFISLKKGNGKDGWIMNDIPTTGFSTDFCKGGSGAGLILRKFEHYYIIGFSKKIEQRYCFLVDYQDLSFFVKKLPTNIIQEIDYELIESWKEKNDEITQKSKDDYPDVEWYYNLNRKLSALYHPLEINKKRESILKQYYQGKKVLDGLVTKSPNLVSDINAKYDKVFEEMDDEHSIVFPDYNSAQEDLKGRYYFVENRFKKDFTGDNSKYFAQYKINEGLLNCSIDYKLEQQYVVSKLNKKIANLVVESEHLFILAIIMYIIYNYSGKTKSVSYQKLCLYYYVITNKDATLLNKIKQDLPISELRVNRDIELVLKTISVGDNALLVKNENKYEFTDIGRDFWEEIKTDISDNLFLNDSLYVLSENKINNIKIY